MSSNRKRLTGTIPSMERRAEITAKHALAMYEILQWLEPILGSMVADDLYKGPMGDRIRLLEQVTLDVLGKIERDAAEARGK